MARRKFIAQSYCVCHSSFFIFPISLISAGSQSTLSMASLSSQPAASCSFSTNLPLCTLHQKPYGFHFASVSRGLKNAVLTAEKMRYVISVPKQTSDKK